MHTEPGHRLRRGQAGPRSDASRAAHRRGGHMEYALHSELSYLIYDHLISSHQILSQLSSSLHMFGRVSY